jgi:hypothetical protein
VQDPQPISSTVKNEERFISEPRVAETKRMYYGISLEEDIAPVSQTECVNETPLKTQTEKSQALVET